MLSLLKRRKYSLSFLENNFVSIFFQPALLSIFTGVSVCNFWIVMDVLCCTASVLHLVAIAIDRYWAVTRANYSRKNNKKVIFGMIVAVWLTSVSISLPSRFTLTENIKLEEAVVSERTCIVNPNKVYTVFSTAGAFFLPITFLVCIYIKIYASARKRIRKQKFKWMKYPSGDNDRMGNFESILTIAEAETLSGLPPNPVKPLANGVSNTKQIFSVEAEYFHYSDKDAYLSSPTIWIDEGDGSDNKDNMNIDNCHANPLFPRPTDGSLIQSPFIPQSPMLPPRRAFNHIPLNSSTHPLIPQSAATPPPLPPVPNSRPPVHTSSVTSSKENGRVMTNSPVQERKHKHVLDTTITYAFMSVKKRLMNKQLSEAALETVLARRERLEHRRERRAARTLAIITGCFLLCWIPFSINALIQPFCGEACALPNSGVKFFLWLGYLNSLLNPIIYTIFSPDYRKAFAKTLTCTYCRSR
ncbi:unnamed protein product [Hymenolepis diminuta]|uniref:G_PROTEIN_RECEP_F1_2 domain-containing protein n=2 Tax=Hymenolepis diminuta TaxID=6216 RepID=A0A0R3SXK5_HYMDI|nr:unnamed protein product [Hymenolepis diminuta]